MPAEWRYRGRVVRAEDIVFIRQFIAQNPGASRRRLSAKLCEAWEWKQANGALCDMICRGLLLMLHRAGEIELPPVRQVSRNPFVDRGRPAPVLLDTTPILGLLSGLQPIELEPVRRSGDEPLFNSLMEQYHYLGYERTAGRRASEISGMGAGTADRLPGLEFGPAASGQPGPVHRLECGGPAAQHSLSCLQHAVLDPALGCNILLDLTNYPKTLSLGRPLFEFAGF
jgi:Domain of unknown function (DUF4338)